MFEVTLGEEAVNAITVLIYFASCRLLIAPFIFTLLPSETGNRDNEQLS
ncbi:hypothetical protein HMPREF3213_01968 [Heyndrickxia coagulans]|uniref:Uncharacterized protein n=1 Tax=Heyndrickxia coagulans TaxID=1398 RepID=A0A133KQE6_HEYCO|nr:hypothetical protein HMPREF3213_01968 [Heyndrickxia coagulans]